jgi:hypothetical protein
MHRVTHFFPTYARFGSWIPLVFITRPRRARYAHYGLDLHRQISPEEISIQTERGNLERLPEPAALSDGELVYLVAPDEIWIAAVESPASDPRRRLIAHQQASMP